ncbi:MAG: DUF1566 domain-containing protein [Nitrospirae bacterium]|nr:DUF1566 domain-containing protein [Nitrospirota bacterium]
MIKLAKAFLISLCLILFYADWLSAELKVVYCNEGGQCPNQSQDCDSNHNNDIVLDSQTGLIWSRDAKLWEPLDFNNAQQKIKDLRLCGYSNWRLPHIRELEKLGGYCTGPKKCAAWLNANGFIGVQPYQYWSRNLDAAQAKTSLHVVMVYNFKNDLSQFILPTYLINAWPVSARPDKK